MNPLATAETTRTIYVNGLRKPNRPELRRRAFFVTSLPFSLEDSRHTHRTQNKPVDLRVQLRERLPQPSRQQRNAARNDAPLTYLCFDMLSFTHHV